MTRDKNSHSTSKWQSGTLQWCIRVCQCGPVVWWLGHWTRHSEVVNRTFRRSAFRWQPLRQVVHTCASVTKQYNQVPVTRRWCSAAGKVTVGLALYWPCMTDYGGLSTYGAHGLRKGYIGTGGLVAEWLACWTQAQKGLGSNRNRNGRVTVLGKLLTPIVPLFTKHHNW